MFNTISMEEGEENRSIQTRLTEQDDISSLHKPGVSFRHRDDVHRKYHGMLHLFNVTSDEYRDFWGIVKFYW